MTTTVVTEAVTKNAPSLWARFAESVTQNFAAFKHASVQYGAEFAKLPWVQKVSAQASSIFNSASKQYPAWAKFELSLGSIMLGAVLICAVSFLIAHFFMNTPEKKP